MKKALFFFLLGGLLITCRKDNSSKQHGTALTKIFQNDVLIYEFEYSGQNRVVRLNGYDEATGNFQYASGFEYDGEGNIVLENQYSSTNKLTGQIINNLAGGGRINYQDYKSLSGADSGQITVRIRYTYDAAERIVVQSWVDLVTDETYTTRELSYYDNGNTRSAEVYYYYSGRELQWKTDYKPQGNPVPAGLIKIMGYPASFTFNELVAEQQHFYSYDNGSIDTETNDVATDRQYDAEGYLVRQKLTLKRIKPVALSAARQMRYEYIKL